MDFENKETKEMNIKSLRRNYNSLTMLERLALADNADSRDDDTEIRAINAASPKEYFSQVDYYDLMKEINTFRLCNLICRFSYIMQFDFFYLRAELALDKQNPSYKDYEKHLEDAKMSAFLYFRSKESWQMVNDELGLRPNWDEEMSELLFSITLMKAKEKIMEELILTIEEVNKKIMRYCGEGRARTVEEEANAIREAFGLPKS